MSYRASSQALRGRARGVVIRSLIALGWAVFGSGDLRPGIRIPILVAAVALTAALVVAGGAMQRRARSSASPTRAQVAANKRVWLLFSLNFIAEIVLLNIAVAWLSAAGLRQYWIPAISAIVGLHFWPMAYLFRVRSYWWVGLAMMVVAAFITVLLMLDGDHAFALVHREGLANAVILWVALGAGVAAARPGA